MSQRHVVVDGSNIATEGRSLPSLAQLDEAVREFRREFPDDQITVVVDATFGHRIDESELEAFKEAEAHGEVVSPPAGAIGRGDAFLLRIAERVGATVLSNDSFQEFHGEHEWLFEKGRLIGGKPVPGIGWIFTPRTPVRGPKSREAVKVAKRAKKAASSGEPAFGSLEEEVAARRSRGRRPPAKEAAKEAAKPPAKPPAKAPPKKVESAIAMATEEAVAPEVAASRRRRRRRSGGSAPPAEPLNQPLAFIEFVSAHRLGSEVAGVVDRFSSHGAFVTVDGAACYIPLSAMGDPPPRAARDVLNRGEERTFVVQALDPPRRGIELALPGFAHVAATPTEETVEEEIAAGHQQDGVAEDATVARSVRKRKAAPDGAGRGGRRGRRGAVVGADDGASADRESGTASPAADAGDAGDAGDDVTAAPTERASAKKSAAKRTAKKTTKAAAKKATAKKSGASTSAAKKDAATEAPAKAGAGRRQPAEATGAATKRAAKAAAKKTGPAAPGTTATAKKVAPKKAAPKKAAPKKAAGAKTSATKQTAGAKTSATKQTATKQTATKHTAPKKRATKQAATTSASPKASSAKSPAATREVAAKASPAKKAQPAAKQAAGTKAAGTKAAGTKAAGTKAGGTKKAAVKTTAATKSPAKKSPAKKSPPAR